MARPRPPKAPTTPDATAIASTSEQAIAQLPALPVSLNLTYPDFNAQFPTDWFKPSSSTVPRVTDAEFDAEAQIAQEQANALELQGLNLDNVEKSVRNAVKATKIGKLIAEYLVGLEEIKTVGVKLRHAQSVTANEEARVLITQEKGRQLSIQLTGEQFKTELEQRKNTLVQSELDFYERLKPVKELEWQNKITAAQQKAQLALGSARS